jgi:hypothetical protein
MQRICTRDKDDGYGVMSLGNFEEQLPKIIDVIVIAELQYGARFTDYGNALTFDTKFMGCIDSTQLNGTNEELAIVRGVVAAFQKGKITAVVQYLQQLMNIDKDVAYTKSNFEDVIALYELYLEGAPVEDLEGLITPIKNNKMVKGITLADIHKQIEEIEDIKNKLDLQPDDGVNKALTSFLGMNLTIERW